MELSLSLIKELLSKNQLIKGRLNFTSSEIQKLYRSSIKHNKNIQLQLSKENSIVNIALKRIKKLKLELKYCEETLHKAFLPSKGNIALLYKKVGNHYYIKARFYWRGKQREVQVGTVEIVLNIIKNMLYEGYFKDISMEKSFQMTWIQFKKKKYLIEATKEIAALKCQEYIIRKLSTVDKYQPKKSDLKKNKNKKEKIISQDEKYNWYLEWGKNNL